MLTRRLPPLPNVSDILRIYGIRSKKQLSQNFLFDPRILDKIARTLGPLEGKTVVEVGPGPGGITRALIANGAREVHVIEKDRRFLPSLKLLQEASGNILHINMGDVLHYNMSRLFSDDLKRHWLEPPPDIRLVGNLPFNISTPLMMKMIRSMQQKDNIFAFGRVPLLLTFQHEFAYRMMAPPGDPERSRLSVMCQNYARINYRFTLPGGAFVPKPMVDVGVVTILPLKTPYIDLPYKFMERVVTTVFMGKQKHLRNTVKNLFPKNMKQAQNAFDLLAMADLDSYRTAISLTMNEIERICYSFKAMCERDPIIERYINSEIVQQMLDYQEENRVFLEDSPTTRSLNE